MIGGRRGRQRVRSWCAITAVAVGTVTACGSTPNASCQDFAVSLSRTTGGSSTAVAAAEKFARSGAFDLPDGGWTDPDGNGKNVRSGRATLHATQGTDGTWFIVSGECA